MKTIPLSLIEMSSYLLIGAACVWPLMYLNIRIAPRLGFIDWPKARGLTDEQIPIVGHSLILVSILFCLILTAYYSLSPWFLTTALIMAVMGYFDDRRPLPALDKIFFQLFCASAVVFLDPLIHEAIVVKYGTPGAAWAILFMVGLINAINFVDGIDGLAGMVIFCGAAGFVLMSHSGLDLYPYFIYASALMGMMVPFLYINVVKRRGFLGNVGSYFFSYVLAVMHLSLPIQAGGPLARLSITALCFLIPMADALVVILTRLLTSRSPFQADKGHLHHRLVQSSLPLRFILVCFGTIEVASVGVGYFIFLNSGARLSLIPTIVCASQIAVAAMLIVLVEGTSRRRLQSYFEHLDAGAPVFFVKYQLSRADGSPVTPTTLRRIEARVSAEIRVADLCFVQFPNILFLTLRTMPEPVKGISGRIDAILQQEQLAARVVVEQGEFIKSTTSRPELPNRRAPRAIPRTA